MLKTIFEITTPTKKIKIPADDGRGAAIQSCTLTECVNSGEELTIGSTCACSLEATLMLVDGDLGIQAGDTVTVSKQLDNNTPTQVGVFVLEKPTRATANTMKIVGYDNVSKLDKDLTVWLSGLTGWPYTLNEFAAEVCKACGLNFTAADVPNMDYEIQQFSKSSVTGRQLMRWLGEICCSFCRADEKGNIEFAWYTPADVEIKTTGDSYYFQNGLIYENYEVAPVTAIQLRLADAQNGALWPAEGVDVTNSYIITGNPILTSKINEKSLSALKNILTRLAAVSYTPCKVSLPASMNIHAGNTVQITDKNDKTITAYVMTKTQTGQKDTLEGTGSVRRDSSSAVNNKTQQEKTTEMENYADAAASAASNQAGNALADAKKYTDELNEALNQLEVLKRLTANGEDDAIYMENGKLAIKATAILTGVLSASLITAGTLHSTNGGVYIDLDKGVGNLARGTSVWLSTWDDDMAGWTKDINEVLREFVSDKLDEMQEDTIRDFAAYVDQNSCYPEGLKLSIYKYRREGAGYMCAMATFEWADGLTSHLTAMRHGDATNWEFSEMMWETPPMEVGVEYCTTERYNGNPVYTKLISCGAMSNAQSITIDTSFEVIRFTAWSDDCTYPYSHPNDAHHRSMHIQRGSATLCCGGSVSSEDVYLRIWYIKV